MTDKELRKLSRLELLEVLLEESKENEKLRKALKNSKSEIAMTEGIKRLSDMTKQASEVIEFANSLSINLKEATKRVSSGVIDSSTARSIGNVPYKSVGVGNHINFEANKEQASAVSDRDLYWRIMGFFAKNNDVLNYLPSDIQDDVRVRVNEILNDIKNKRHSQS